MPQTWRPWLYHGPQCTRNLPVKCWNFKHGWRSWPWFAASKPPEVAESCLRATSSIRPHCPCQSEQSERLSSQRSVQALVQRRFPVCLSPFVFFRKGSHAIPPYCWDLWALVSLKDRKGFWRLGSLHVMEWSWVYVPGISGGSQDCGKEKSSALLQNFRSVFEIRLSRFHCVTVSGSIRRTRHLAIKNKERTVRAERRENFTSQNR